MFMFILDNLYFFFQHPVLMAINLSLDQDHLISNINQTHACVKAPSSGQTDDKANSDEMDTSRTQRRFNIYLNSVKEFLTYFESDEKLLTVDTSCGDVDAVWQGVRNYITIESEIALPCRGLAQVVLLKMCMYLIQSLQLSIITSVEKSANSEILQLIGFFLQKKPSRQSTFQQSMKILTSF